MKQGMFILLMAVLLGIWPAASAEAAMAKIELQTESDVVHVDDEFELSIVITAQPSEGESAAAAIIGDFEAFLIYDDTIFEFVTAPSCITGGAGNLRISDLGAQGSKEIRKYVIRFRALERGNSNFSFYTQPLVYVYGGGSNEIMTTGSDILEMKVEANANASDNANLSALKVSPGYLTPTFATNLREYEVTVPNTTEMIIVSALTEDPNASVGVNGSTNLVVGKNKVTITVTAENGDEKRYYLYVTRKEKVEEPTQAAATPIPEQKGYEEGIHAEERNGKIVLSLGAEYTVSDDPQDYAAPTGYEETVLFLDAIKVKAYVKRGSVDSDFFVLLLKGPDGKVGYYRYDRKEQTIQRYDEDRIEIRQMVTEDNTPLLDTITKYKNNQVLLLFALALFLSLSITFLLISIRLYRSRNTTEEEQEEEDLDEMEGRR